MTVGWGIIGTGDVADRKGGPALYQANRSNLIGITNRTLSRAESFASRHGDPRVFPTIEALLSERSIDAVYVATPPASHAAITEQVAAAGKHVLCEKPMAMTVDECARMIEVCERNNISLSIAYYRRYFPVVVKMKSLIEEGAIGTPRRINATTIDQFQSSVENPWRLDPTISGGGFLVDMGSHRFDLFSYFFGRHERVLGITGHETLGVADDMASVAIKFENGVHGSAVFHWNCPIHRDSLEVVGSDGILWTESLSAEGRLMLETTRGKESWDLPSPSPVHLNLVQRVVDHILDGSPNPASGESCIVASEMISAIYDNEQNPLKE